MLPVYYLFTLSQLSYLIFTRHILIDIEFISSNPKKNIVIFYIHWILYRLPNPSSALYPKDAFQTNLQVSLMDTINYGQYVIDAFFIFHLNANGIRISGHAHRDYWMKVFWQIIINKCDPTKCDVTRPVHGDHQFHISIDLILCKCIFFPPAVEWTDRWVLLNFHVRNGHLKKKYLTRNFF